MIEKKFLESIKRYKLIDKNDNILIAFSGGPDSSILLHLLVKFKEYFQINNIYVAHLNHSLRKESDKDELFCKKLADKYNLKFFSKKVDIKLVSKENKLSIEEAGRIERYKFFNELTQQYKINKIATAHHLSDLTESIVLWFIQGNKKGLKGFRPKEGNIIRPLYLLLKEEILDYCHKNNIPYLTDLSNYSPIYLRNKVRLDIIPKLKEINPNLENSLLILSQLQDFDESFLNEKSEEMYKEVIEECFVNLDKLNNLPKPFIYRILIKWIYENTGVYLSYSQILSILDILNKKGEKEFRINKDYKIIKSYDKLIISEVENMENLDIKYKLKVGEKVYIKELNVEIESFVMNVKDYKKEYNIECFDLPIDSEFEIRTRKEGDKFLPFGRKTEKKLKEVFIDLKIPKHMRNNIPLLTFNDKILWIVGYKRSDYFKISENSKDVVCFKFKEVKDRCN